MAQAKAEGKKINSGLIDAADEMTNGSTAVAIEQPPFNPEPLWGDVKIPILGVSGEKSAGKTLFVSSIDPLGTGIIDIEGSSETFTDIPYKKRWNLYQEMMVRKNGAMPTPLEVFDWYESVLREEIKPGEFTVIASDPINEVEAGMQDKLYANPGLYGRTKNQYDQMSALLLGDVKQYWKMILGLTAEKCECFAFTTHIGQVFAGGKPVPNKIKTKGKSVLYELASLYLFLERPLEEKDDGTVAPKEIPCGITVPPLAKNRLVKSIVEGRSVKHISLVPPRIPEATPDAIREYIKHPPNFKRLKKEERITEQRLSEDDKLVLQHDLAVAQRDTEQIKQERESSRLERMKAAAAVQKANSEESHEAVVAEQEVDSPEVAVEQPVGREHVDGFKEDLQEMADDAFAIKLREEIKTLVSQVGLTADQWECVLKKRNVDSLMQLDGENLKDLRDKLFALANQPKKESAA